MTEAEGLQAPVLKQDPHKVGTDQQEKVLEVAIGREVKAVRKQQNITVLELSKKTGISPGMLSKIENGLTSPSLTTLQTLSEALSVSLTSFFRRFEEQRSAVLVKAGSGMDVDRAGTRAGHQYNLLGHVGSNASGVIVEPYLIELIYMVSLALDDLFVDKLRKALMPFGDGRVAKLDDGKGTLRISKGGVPLIDITRAPVKLCRQHALCVRPFAGLAHRNACSCVCVPRR